MISKLVLFPYYLVLRIRNLLYDKGAIGTQSYDVPVIAVGNVTVGGTGKTPVTEMVIRSLRKDFKVAVVSRGYRRSGREFTFVSVIDNSRRVGDEPLQIKRKFPDVIVVVDVNRNRAVRQLLLLPPEARPDVIVLDDALQYRRLTARKNIVTVSYTRPIFRDELLPLGRLRDLPEQIRRAQMVIITKCPEYLDEWERDKIRVLTRVRPSQLLLFSKMKYCLPKAVFPENGDPRYIYSKEVYLFAGIADDLPLIHYLSARYDSISHKAYGDHHRYTRSDIAALNSFARRHPRTFLLTTEKDAQRLTDNRFVSDAVRTRLFYIPIEAELLSQDEEKVFVDFLKENIRGKTDEAEEKAPEEEAVKSDFTGLLF